MSDEGGSGSLVVIGASAGGIDALSVLAAHLPVPFPAPIVVAQHLDPSRQSHLVQILAQRTSLPVEAVTDHVALEAGHVYVIPPNSDVTVEDGHLSLDLLFRTAAGAYGERLIAVILSGAGSDGSGGARFVKAAGGTVVVQDPATASHPSMPSALPPAIVDLVAKLEAIGSLLRDLVAGEYPRSGGDDDTNLDHFLAELRERSGIDFSTYKRPTIRRRLDRRRLAVGATSLSAYMQYAAEHPEEYARLTSAFLIKVTEFFRDADLFEYLGTTVMPEIVRAAAERDHEIRIWSAGCASGEEAYGLAMLLADAVGNDLAAFNIRVFGTDLDGDAVNFARGATYPASAVATIPPDRLERYFIRSGADYEVRKHIRAMTVFGQHDLGMRSPFPRIDLVVSRNVLIYFTPELQKRALQLFAFALRDRGYLVLGKAESTAQLVDHFVVEQPRLKVYRRQGEQVLIPPLRVPPPARDLTVARSKATPRRAEESPQELRARAAAESTPTGGEAEIVLQGLPLGLVIVNRRYDIQLINRAARRLLGIHGRAIGEDFVHTARTVPPTPARELIDAAFRGEPAELQVEITTETPVGASRTVRISGHLPEPGGSTDRSSVVLQFIDVSDFEQARREARADADRLAEESARLSSQIQGLARTNAELLGANDELTNENADLHRANEDLVVSSEEVQAATEEVETLNEELQATNEELETLNEELQATVEELNTTNDDLAARTLELEELARDGTELASRPDTERLRDVLGRLSAPIAVTAGDGRITWRNGAWSADLGDAGRMRRPIEKQVEELARAGEFDTIMGSGSRRWRAQGDRIVDGDAGFGLVVLAPVDLDQRDGS